VPRGARRKPGWSLAVLDVLYIVGVIAVFAVVALVARGVERL
jgi:hypothetical protein